MTSAAGPRVVVVGGGVTGLAAAYHVLRLQPEARLTLLEGSGRLGGCIATEEREGFVIDAGPDSFLATKPDGVALCRELGIDGEFISTRPEARHVYVAHRGGLELMPAGMVLAVPTRVGPMLKTPLLSFPAKLRVLGDIGLGFGWRKSDRPIDDESIAAFLSRHFGEEATSRIGGPLLGGLYAGDISDLSIRATFPQLVELEAEHGSVILGLFAQHLKRSRAEDGRGKPGLGELWHWLRREPELAPSPFVSLRGGMQRLIGALAERIPADVIHLNEGVTSIGRGESAARWTVASESTRYDADAVVVTVPANGAVRMLPKGRLRDELSQIRYVSTAAVFFALDRTQVQHSLEGSGFIVPAGEGEILAATWVSSKWDGRAPGGSVLLRAFIGESRGAPSLEHASDAELVSFARAGLERLMGPLGPSLFERVFRYVHNRPQPTVGHKARLRRIAAELEFLPGLHLAGAAYDGVGIPDCVRQARAAAERLSQGLE